MQIVAVSEDEIREWIEKAISDTMRRFEEAKRKLPDKPYMTKRELMALTGWSSRQVEYRKSSGDLPFIRRNRLVLFPTNEVLSWLEEGRVPAKE